MTAAPDFPAIAAELGREHAARTNLTGRRVDEGRMTRRDAERALALVAAWQRDLERERTRRATIPLAPAPPAPCSFTWRERRDGLLHELALRARLYPQWIAADRLAAADAAHRTRCLEALLELYEAGLDWPADPDARITLTLEIGVRRGEIDPAHPDLPAGHVALIARLAPHLLPQKELAL